MVIDPSFESVRLARRVQDMAMAIDVPVYYVLNKTDKTTADSLKNAIPDQKRIIGEFRQDPVILSAGLHGREVPAEYPPVVPIAKTLEMRMKAD